MKDKYSYAKISSNEELESYLTDYTAKINNAYQCASKTTRVINNSSPPPHVKNLIKQRNQARKTWQNSRAPSDKTKFNQLNTKIRDELYKIRQEQWKDYIINLSPQDSSIWQAVKKFTGKRNHIPPLKNNNIYYYDNEDKANIIAEKLKTQFTNNNLSSSETNCRIGFTTRSFYQNSHNTHPELATPLEIIESIKSTKNKKCPGIDKINNKIIKNLPLNYIFYLTTIINAIMKLSYFPSQWKTATVTPIENQAKIPKILKATGPLACFPHSAKSLKT